MKPALLFVIAAALAIIVAPAYPAIAEDDQLVGGLAPEAGDIQEFKLIHADMMTLTRQEDKPQVFKGSVHIVLVDEAGEETEIKAEKITILYEQNLKEVRRIEAEGRVKVSRLGSVATTELAIYRGDENVIEMLIDPHIKDSRGELSANKIVIHLDTDEVVAEGNVRGVVYTEAFEENPPK
jgi:lipopolysaccharide export system protein LptA